MGITSYLRSDRSSSPELARFIHYEVQEMYHWPVSLYNLYNLYNLVTNIFWCQINFCRWEPHFIETYLVDAVAETIVITQRSVWWETETMEVTRVKPASFQHILLQQKHLLSLLSYLWHYNRYFDFPHCNSTHSTLNPYGRRLMSKNSSYHEHLYYSKMAAVSVRHMHTGSYAHLI